MDTQRWVRRAEHALMLARARTKLRQPHAKATMGPRAWSAWSCCLLRCRAANSATTASASGSGGGASLSSVSVRYRRRLRRPSPHWAVQRPQSCQCDQVQKASAPHLRGQLPISSCAACSQFWPPDSGYWAMWRKRFLSPSHLAQALQSCQSPYLQSLGSRTQESRPHSETSIRGPSQALPPCDGSRRTSRLRIVLPPPQLAEQSLHSVQLLSKQSVGGTCAQPSGTRLPGPGLQGEVSLRPPTQKRPLPRP
mmetsp:Transcript_100457/g.279759  ORF Transcript_100457/g.279759 Transcript_100457/m.279759 type:complete len:252 (+) Transcript_100457:153-908(+)